METYAIETCDLMRRFGDVTAVQQVALQVPPGSVYGFLGPNGAGKTTTIRMLLGLIRPTSGLVRLLDQPLQGRRISLLRQVGALVESPSLYPHLTGRENLEVTRRLLGIDHRRVGQVLEVVHMASDADRHAGGYSTGMRQRLSLALALLPAPRLLILDEPTNGLDPAGIREVRALIRRLPEEMGVTVFLSSHLLGEVEQVASHLGIISSGRLLFQGRLDALQAFRQTRLTLVVDLAAEAAAKLRAAGWEVEQCDEQTLHVATASQASVARINTLLVDAGIEVYRLTLERPSLEDTFLRLTSSEGDGAQPSAVVTHLDTESAKPIAFPARMTSGKEPVS
ncbi:MAG: ATP-binding cassette domain-containing protein [Anaerolineae bacterium]